MSKKEIVITPQIRKYLENLLGKEESEQLLDAMSYNAPILITGPHVATGKSTLVDVLRAIGYERVREEWEVITIPVREPLTHLREKDDIFAELGIEMKH